MATFVLVHGAWHGSWCWKRVRSLVFLDAFVPDDGQCLADFAPISDDALIDGWKCPPITATVFGPRVAGRPARSTAATMSCWTGRMS